VGGGGACPDGAAYTPGGYAQIPVNDGIYTCASGTWAPEVLVVGSVDQTGATPTCSSSTAGMLYYTGGVIDYCNGSSFAALGSASGSALSAITAATGANTIANGSNAQVWNWALGATTNTGISFGESSAATTGGEIVNIATLSSSTAVPLTITNGGSSAFAINMSAGGLAIGGANVLALPDTDTTSIAVGQGALAVQSATSLNNTAVGDLALTANTNGSGNTGVGYEALTDMITGSDSTAVGSQALLSATGSPNTALGYEAGEYVTTGADNIAIGYIAMQGVSANPITGSGNLAIGDNALNSITGGATGNVAIGYNVLTSSTVNSTNPNTAIGNAAMQYATTGTNNTAIGKSAMKGTSANPMTGAGYNTAIGDSALAAITGAAADNTAIGQSVLIANTSGSSNTGVGQSALNSNTTGSNSTAAGESALWDATGSPNEALGSYAGRYITTSSDNIAIGYQAMQSTTANPVTAANAGNVAIGDQALEDITGAAAGNVAVGYQALLYSTSGSDNTAIGNVAMQGWSGFLLTGAGHNTAIGNNAGAAVKSTVQYNTAVGDQALLNDTTGNYNTVFGYLAGSSINTATYNTLVGYQSGYDLNGADDIILGEDTSGEITSGATNILIGNALAKVVGSTSDQLDIGDLITGVIGSAEVAINTTTYEGTGLTIGKGYGLYVRGATSGYIGIKASTTTTSATYTLPTAAPTTASMVLSSTTAGVMSWTGNPPAANPPNGSDLEFQEGTAAAPSLSFTSDTKTGIYQASSATNTLDFASNGAQIAEFDNSGDFDLTNAGGTSAGTYEMLVSGTSYQVLLLPDKDTTSIVAGVQADAGQNVTNAYNVAIGNNALNDNTSGTDNTAVGADAVYAFTTSSGNTGVGCFNDDDITSGAGNTTFGMEAMGLGTGSTSDATAIGDYALEVGSSVSDTTAIGSVAGNSGSNPLTTGTSDVYIGYHAQPDTSSDSNTIVIGASTTSNASSNAITMGNTFISAAYVHTAFTTYSDGRHKKDIEDSDLGLDFIDKLRPVSYRFNNGDETLRYGFIAQDVEAALPPTLRDMVEKSEPEHGLSLIVREHNDEGTYHMTYEDLISPLVKSVQQLESTGDTEQQQIDNGRKKEQDDVNDIKQLIAHHQQEIDDVRQRIRNLTIAH
jgi:hypothetical protein